ncbi:hypothetical protein [Roseospira goensis]|uniref:Uncharacterized protein n=1 Tax=Roseospira goensis TaxID=391922 RepID=A0A7W6RWJ9_9PROT|nr:hypothetical protein [Roseospira goensis]MBB4284569.1 hypothetical protein [Roseospira goensis]
MGEKLEEALLRLTRLESGQARIRQDLGSHAETEAHLQAQIDRLRADVDRINRRLDLTKV